MPAFDQQEYRERTARLRERMAERGMDALLVFNEANMNYLTGYDGYSDYNTEVVHARPNPIRKERPDYFSVFAIVATFIGSAKCPHDLVFWNASWSY